MKKSVKRIGILTAGGDCPGLNAVIRAVVKKSINDYSAEVTGFHDGFRGLILDDSAELTYDMVSGILHEGGTILGSSNRDNPFSFYYDDNQEGPADVSERVVENYNKHGLDALICIGGDGTLTISHKLAGKGLNVVGVPKTIDNDVQGTDQTFGFDTAVTTAAEAIDKIRTTAASHHRAMVVELMGRTAGWLTLFAGIASGSNVILIPELPFSIGDVCGFVKKRSAKGRQYSIITVAEGAREKDGSVITVEGRDRNTGMVRLGGISQYICQEIEKRTGIESRVAILGHVQRGGTPTPFDRILATRYGTKAVDLVMNGITDVTVCLKGQNIDFFPLSKVADNPRRVQGESEYIKIASSVGTFI